MSPSLPRYVEYGARATAPPPFVSEEGHFHGYVLEGVKSRISALCKRMLNTPAGGTVEYRPLSSRVIVLTGKFGHVASQASNFQQVGYVEETQISFWVPLVAGQRVGPLFVPERLCMAVPYILVDNPMSYLGGREDFGYPKAMGTFQPADGLGDVVQVQGYGGNYGSGNLAAWHPLLYLARNTAAAASPAAQAGGGPQGGWDASADLVSQLLGLSSATAIPGVSADATLGGNLLAALLGEPRQVFLKQFRDAAIEGAACYQAVVESPIRITSLSLNPTADEWRVTVHPLDSHPIGSDLGVASQTTRMTFELDMEMVVGAGVVVGP